jgi:alpha 1,2-mannosyltransferase
MKPGCFVYLVNHTARAVADGVTSLALLKMYYLNRFPTPVLLFHEAGLTDDMKACLATAVPVTFISMDFSSYPNGTGYNHMCRFFAGEIFKHPALVEYAHYCRLDTDSFLLAPIAYDLFEFAEANGVHYGFLNDAIVDHPEFVTGLWDTVRQFGIATENIPEGRLYYTNFEVCYTPWFRGDVYQAFYRAIDAAGGIQAHRWGDHTIRYIGVKAFMVPECVRQMPGIQYSHQGIGAS